jgi:serine/threonine protein kinase
MAQVGSEDGRLVNGRYRLVDVIGRGGMGTVWHGHDELLDREVAIKEIRLPPDLDDEERSLLSERAKREARATAGLNHPGIITVYDVIEHDGAPMIVMEYIDGRSLASLVKEKVRLPWRRVAEIGAIMLDALRVAHAAGVVHRDLKPANVLLSGDRVVITDFGIAHRTGEITLSEPGELVGTPAFMAPEQAEHATVTPASDLWSLGATLFAAVEGRPPYTGPDFVTTLLSLLTQEPAKPRNAGPLGAVIDSLLRKNPTRRATGEQVAAALATILHPAAPTQPAPPKPSVPVQPAPAKTLPPKPQPYPRSPAPVGKRATAIKPRLLHGVAAAFVVTVGLAIALVVTLSFTSASSSHARVAGPASTTVPTPEPDGAPSLLPSEIPPPDSLPLIESMAVSADGSTVAVASMKEYNDDTVRLWRATDHKLLGTLPVGATAMAFSPDHKTLATVDDQGNLGLWNLASHRREQGEPLPAFDFNVMAMTISPDGRTVVFAGNDDGNVQTELGIWRVGTTTVTVTPIDDYCATMALSRDATTLACAPASGAGLALWSVAAHRQTATLATAPATPVYAIDGVSLATSATDGSIDLSTILTQQNAGTLPTDASRLEALAFDGRGEIADIDDKGVIRLWDLTTRKQLTHWSGDG